MKTVDESELLVGGEEQSYRKGLRIAMERRDKVARMKARAISVGLTLPWILIVLGVIGWYVRTIELRFAGLAAELGATESIVLLVTKGSDGKPLATRYKTCLEATRAINKELAAQPVTPNEASPK